MPRLLRLTALLLLSWAITNGSVLAAPFVPKAQPGSASAQAVPPESVPAEDAEPAGEAKNTTDPNFTPAPGSAAHLRPVGGSLSYRARVVHNDRAYISLVSGRVDYASQSADEQVEQSYLLDWKRMPGGLVATHPMLPSVWQSGGRTAHQLGKSIPHYENPRLRHFLLNTVIASPQSIAVGDKYLTDQLEIGSVSFDPGGFEIVAQFRGGPLVIVGSGTRMEGWYQLQDMVVLGPQHELYQYFFDSISRSEQALASVPQIPGYDPAQYVSFPASGGTPVAIRPVKDWLVFQAKLPSGRPLNLVFDSGAETMILDDMVLKLDARLRPVGKVAVAGALELGEMELFEGLAFEVGGVQFENLTVLGAPMTQLGFGADLRIHGIVGSEILQLCQLDIDLEQGALQLHALGAERPDVAQELPLTFIEELPHVEAEVHDTGRALLLLDTGQRTGLTVNWDWLESYKMSDDLKMDGFLGDITGGMQPRYIMEECDLSIGGQTYTERTVSATPDSTYHYDGLPVVGSIGFPLIARHFGGITFDYSRRKVYLREPAEERVFTGRPEAWEQQGEPLDWKLTTSRAEPSNEAEAEDDPEAQAELLARGDKPAAPPAQGAARDPRRPLLLPESPSGDGDPRSNYSWFEYWEMRNAREATGDAGELADAMAESLEEEAGGELLLPPAQSEPSKDPALELPAAADMPQPEVNAGRTVPPAASVVAALARGTAASSERAGQALLARALAAQKARESGNGEDVPPADENSEAADSNTGGVRPLKRGLPKLKFD